MRPIYERSINRAAQFGIAERCLHAWHTIFGLSEFVMTPELCVYDVDFLAEFEPGRPAVVLIVEAKARSNEWRRYPTYSISARKLADCLNESVKRRVTFRIVAGFTDGDRWVEPRRCLSAITLAIGGRSDRVDPADQELMAHIPVELMRPVE